MRPVTSMWLPLSTPSDILQVNITTKKKTGKKKEKEGDRGEKMREGEGEKRSETNALARVERQDPGKNNQCGWTGNLFSSLLLFFCSACLCIC